ncbi:MAG: hypothetical protein Aureis2KO_25990 [Aureisphaera sp.]
MEQVPPSGGTLHNVLISREAPKEIELSTLAVDTSAQQIVDITPQIVPFIPDSVFAANKNKVPIRFEKTISLDTNRFWKGTLGKDSVPLPISYTVPKTGYIIVGKDSIHAPKTLSVSQSEFHDVRPFVTTGKTTFDLAHLGVDQGWLSPNTDMGTEDSKGNLWFISSTGSLFKYDGVSVVDYAANLESAFLSFYDMAIDHDDTIWIRSYAGLVKFDGNQFTIYDSKMFRRDIRDIQVDSKNNVWVGTITNGLIKVESSVVNGEDQTAFTHYKVNLESFKLYGIRTIHVLEDDSLLLGCGAGLVFFDGSSFYNPLAFNDAIDLSWLEGIAKDKDGFIWVATSNNLYKYDPSTNLLYMNEQSFKDGELKSLYLDSKNRIWITQIGMGLSVIENEFVTNLNTSNGLSTNTVNGFFEDSQGSFWFGSQGVGISRLHYDSFSLLPVNSEFGEQPIGEIFQDTQGNVWMAKWNGGLLKFRDGVYHSYFKNNPYEVMSLFEDSLGTLWIGYDGGFYVRQGDKLHFYEMAKGFMELAEDRNGTMWVGTHMGLYTFSGDTLKWLETNSEEFNNANVNDIEVDDAGRLWISTSAGLFMYDMEAPDQMTHINASSNLICNDAVFDADRNLLVATNQGLFRFDTSSNLEDLTELTYVPFRKSDGLSSNYLTKIHEDTSGDIWVISDTGINRIVSNGKDYENTIMNSETGYYGGVVTSISNITHEDQNSLWLGTTDYIIKKDLDLNEETHHSLLTQLQGLEINEQSIPYNNGQDSPFLEYFSSMDELSEAIGPKVPFYDYPEFLHLPYTLNHLNFKFSAVDWSSNSHVRYSHIIEGLSTSWSTPSIASEVDYRNIPPGDYVFKVKAFDEIGRAGDTFQYPFTIFPPWWLTWWAKLLAFLAVLGVVLALVKLRISLLRKSLKKEEAFQIRIKDLEAKALIAQMNPHFIFNALNGIQSVMILEGEREANRYLDSFSKLLRLTLEVSSSSYITLKDEIAYLKSYLQLEEMRLDGNLEVIFNVDEDLDLQGIKIPRMLFQPIIENAIIHGLIPKKEDRVLHISFYGDGSYLTGEVRDNGIGREAAAKRKASRKVSHKSWATRIMAERIKIRNSLHEQQLSFKIEDIYKGEMPAGTRVRLEIPVMQIDTSPALQIVG